MKRNNVSPRRLWIMLIMGFVGLMASAGFAYATLTNGTIDPNFHFAWSDKMGWIQFLTAQGDIHVTDTAVTGYAWSKNYGWINLSPLGSGWGVANDGLGNLSGYAWSQGVGPINFSGVTIASTGKFTGTATSTIGGTLTFDCGMCDVRTDWRPASLRGGGGGFFPPRISLVKIASPAVLVTGAGPVTYTYVVNNVGSVAMHDVSVTDDHCAQVVYESGDVDADTWLDVNEEWRYSCAALLSVTTTNIATAIGYAGGMSSTDTAAITVQVAPDIAEPPLLSLTKTASALQLPAGGGVVRYSYRVANIGVPPIENLLVEDDGCQAINWDGGDTNTNGFLDPNEVWIFSCSTTLTSTTTSRATVTGSAGGITALDTVTLTVIVGTEASAPTLSQLNLSLSANPLVLPAGGGAVTYTYRVNFSGAAAIRELTVVDNACSTPGYRTGDTDGDGLLDPLETWSFTCTTNRVRTTTSVATATGRTSDGLVVDTASLTVVVLVPLAPPSIHVVKQPNHQVLPRAGGNVLYTYNVTNVGTVPMREISITDDQCAPVVFVTGDADNDQLLDVSEAWIYECNSALSQTTTNTVTVRGRSNGYVTTDTDAVTVVVAEFADRVPEPGSYIRTVSSSAVYFISPTGYRRPFINALHFFTYDVTFKDVMVVEDAVLGAFPLGRPMLPNPQTVLMKIVSSPKVFAFSPVYSAEHPIIQWIPSEDLAIHFYGREWADYVIDLDPTLFVQFEQGNPLTAQDTVITDKLIKRSELALRFAAFLRAFQQSMFGSIPL